MFDRIKIVLVEPQYPRNIGSVARALKNMGLKHLILVRPHDIHHPEIREMASRAGDIIDNAEIYGTLQEALQNTVFAFATSNRPRTFGWPILSVKEAAQVLKQQLVDNQTGDIAVVFGTESSGLGNEDLQLCNAQLQIKAHPEYSVLNLAQTVQIVTYEIFNALDETTEMQNAPKPSLDNALASHEKKESFFAYLESFVRKVGYKDEPKNSTLLIRLRRLFTKANLEEKEVNIIRGILKSAEKKFNE